MMNQSGITLIQYKIQLKWIKYLNIRSKNKTNRRKPGSTVQSLLLSFEFHASACRLPPQTDGLAALYPASAVMSQEAPWCGDRDREGEPCSHPIKSLVFW